MLRVSCLETTRRIKVFATFSEFASSVVERPKRIKNIRYVVRILSNGEDENTTNSDAVQPSRIDDSTLKVPVVNQRKKIFRLRAERHRRMQSTKAPSAENQDETCEHQHD